jgi:hypothetical protein
LQGEPQSVRPHEYYVLAKYPKIGYCGVRFKIQVNLVGKAPQFPSGHGLD